MSNVLLEDFCDRHKNCDRKCVSCPAFTAFQRHQTAEDDEDEEE